MCWPVLRRCVKTLKRNALKAGNVYGLHSFRDVSLWPSVSGHPLFHPCDVIVPHSEQRECESMSLSDLTSC